MSLGILAQFNAGVILEGAQLERESRVRSVGIEMEREARCMLKSSMQYSSMNIVFLILTSRE